MRKALVTIVTLLALSGCGPTHGVSECVTEDQAGECSWKGVVRTFDPEPKIEMCEEDGVPPKGGRCWWVDDEQTVVSVDAGQGTWYQLYPDGVIEVWDVDTEGDE